MRAAVVGGTGTLGRLVATELADRGHDVRALSRSSPEWPVDLKTGAGLADALDGVDVVVDASNDASRRAAQTLVDGAKRLLAAEAQAGVAHHICVSIVGCDALPVGYYATKVDQERAVQAGPVPWSIVRATQFHELVAGMLGKAARWRVLPVPRVLVQPVACVEVAAVVADVAEGAPRHGRVQVAGPQVEDARALVRTWARTTRHKLRVVPVWLPGKFGRALRNGVITTQEPDTRGRATFAGWLATHAPHS